MSHIQSTLKCQKCGYEMNVAFGIVGTTQQWGWPTKCSECGSRRIPKVSDGWNAKNENTK